MKDRGTDATLAMPPNPFEVRCRVVLSDSPVVPGADDDPAISRPEPNAAEQASQAVDPLAAATDSSVKTAGRAGRAASKAVEQFLMEYLSGPTGSHVVADDVPLTGDAPTPELAAAVRARLGPGNAGASATTSSRPTAGPTSTRSGEAL